MKKRIISIIVLISLFSAFILLLNVDVTTRQGRDYAVSTKKIPLYFKVLGFLYRHFAYKQLTREIIREGQSDQEKVLAIFKWTCENIKKLPKGLPIVDDHILNIIIRGYGACDQSADVFCILCEYAGFPAAWVFISPATTSTETGPKIVVSLVQLEGKWRLFDTYFGNYFLGQDGSIASVDELVANPKLADQAGVRPAMQGYTYAQYFVNLKYIRDDKLWKRGRVQMPLNRLLYEIKRRWGRFRLTHCK